MDPVVPSLENTCVSVPAWGVVIEKMATTPRRLNHLNGVCAYCFVAVEFPLALLTVFFFAMFHLTLER